MSAGTRWHLLGHHDLADLEFDHDLEVRDLIVDKCDIVYEDKINEENSSIY